MAHVVPPYLYYQLYGLGQHGGLVVFDGGPLGPRTAADARLVLTGSCYAWFGEAFALGGDITGDGARDALVGGYSATWPGHYKTGLVAVLGGLGTLSGTHALLDVADAVFFGERGDDLLGDVTPLGDLDDDGFDDFAIAARFGGPSGSAPGRVYVFRGPVAGAKNAADADLVLEGGALDRFFGAELHGGQDLDGDGVEDLLVTAFGSRWTGMDAGSVYLFSGAALLGAM
jgi:hypothetical protein